MPGGTYRMGSDRHYPEEAPVHRVTVDEFWMDRTPVTNRQFRKFVNETGYVTFAEIAPEAKDYPGALPHMLKAGSLVFTPPKQTVDLRNWGQWWTFKFGANWRRPYGPRSNISGLDDHPVVHVAYRDAEAYAKWVGKELPTEAEWEFGVPLSLPGAMTSEVLTVEQMYAADRFAVAHGMPSLELMEQAGLRRRRRNLQALDAARQRRAVRTRKQWRRRLCRRPPSAGARLECLGRNARRQRRSEGRCRRDGAALDRRDDSDRRQQPHRPNCSSTRCSVRVCRGRSRARRDAWRWPRSRSATASSPSTCRAASMATPPRPLDGVAFRAALTVTFFRKKPAHLLAARHEHCAATSSSPTSAFPNAALDEIKPQPLRERPGALELSLAESRGPQIRPRSLRRGQRPGARDRRRAARRARRAARWRRARQRRQSARRGADQRGRAHRDHGQAVCRCRRACRIC